MIRSSCLLISRSLKKAVMSSFFGHAVAHSLTRTGVLLRDYSAGFGAFFIFSGITQA